MLSWLATAYARATGEDRQAVLDRINPWMGEHGKLSQADPVLFDEKWMTFMNENLTEDDFSETDQSRVHRRFGSVAINLGFA